MHNRIQLIGIAMLLMLAATVSAEIVPTDRIIYQKSFDSPSFEICQETFQSSALQYKVSCGDMGNIDAGEVPDSCFSATVIFGDNSYLLNHNQEISLPGTPFNVKMTAAGEAKDGMLEQDDWTIFYEFKLNNPEFLTSQISNTVTVQKLNSEFQLGVQNQNAFSQCQGGYYVTVSPQLYPVEERFYNIQKIPGGTSSLSIPMEFTQLGQNTVTIKPFITVGNVNLMQRTPSVKGFYVTPQGVQPTDQCQSDAQCQEGYECQTYQQSAGNVKVCSPKEKKTLVTEETLYIGAGALLIAISLATLIYFKKRK